MNKWIEYTGAPPKNLGSIPRGEVGLGSDGNWWAQKNGRLFFMPAAKDALMKVGAGDSGYVPLNGNYVVDAGTADDLVNANGGWTSPVPNGSWPGSMTQEANRYLQSAPSEDIYIWCGDNKKIYQLGTNGDLLAVGDPGASFDPTVPAGITCAAGQVWDPIQKKCVTPSSSVSWWTKLSTLGKAGVIGGGAAVVLGGGYLLVKHGKKRGRR